MKTLVTERRATDAEFAEARSLAQSGNGNLAAVFAYAARKRITVFSQCESCKCVTPDAKNGFCMCCGVDKHNVWLIGLANTALDRAVELLDSVGGSAGVVSDEYVLAESLVADLQMLRLMVSGNEEELAKLGEIKKDKIVTRLCRHVQVS
jgi:hypothetical protein